MDATRSTMWGLLLAAGTVAAQEAPLAPSPSTAQPGVVFRLALDGDRLDAIPVVQPATDAAADALDTGVLGGLAGVLSMPLDTSSRLRVGVGANAWFAAPVAPATTGAPWCSQLGAWLAMSGFGNACVVAAGAERQPRIDSGRAGLAFTREQLGLGLSYGVSRGEGLLPFALAGVGDAGAIGPLELSYPGLDTTTPIPGLTSVGQDLSARATWRFAGGPQLIVGASMGDGRLQFDSGLPGLAYDHAALGVGLRYGPFSGGVVGRVMRPSDGGLGDLRPWAGLDIGVSWRTPWQGELTFGARNLISRQGDPLLPDPTASAVIDEASARTPFVRYKQDL